MMGKPKIRFKGYNEDWEQRKLESLCDVFTDGDWIEAKDQSDSGIRLVQTGNVGTTEYLDKENNKKWISEETFERLHCEEIYEGDILISRLPEPAGRACIMSDLGIRMITAVDCTIVRTSKECDSKYLVQYLSTPMYFKVVNSFLGGGTRQRISRGNLSGIDIPIPSTIDEQGKIGELFANLDNLITLHQHKCDEMKKLKKCMLQKMFPQNGEKVPEIRFDGFTNDWEQRKLGEVLVSLQNNTLSRADLSNETGIAKNIHYGDVLIKFGEVLDVSEEKLPMISDKSVLTKYKASFLRNGDVIVTDTAEDSTVGKCSEIAGLNDEVVLSGLHTIPYRPIEKFASGYLGYYLNSSAYHKQLIPLMQGIKVTSISKSAMQNTEIVYPKSVEEQGKIGNYFQSLDHLITLHQHKRDELQNLKKYMLQNIFV